jgi:hypothetical protein
MSQDSRSFKVLNIETSVPESVYFSVPRETDLLGISKQLSELVRRGNMDPFVTVMSQLK